MIAHAARSGLGGVVIVNRVAIFARVLFAALRQFGIAHLVVEDYDLLGARGFLQDALDLGIVGSLHFVLIVEVAHCGLLMRQLEALLVERQVADNLARVSNRHGVRDEFSSRSRRSGWRLVGVVNGLLAGLGSM